LLARVLAGNARGQRTAVAAVYDRRNAQRSTPNAEHPTSNEAESQTTNSQLSTNASPARTNSQRSSPSSTFYFLLSTFVWLILVEVAAAGWYWAHERNLVAHPTWKVRWPQTALHYHE